MVVDKRMQNYWILLSDTEATQGSSRGYASIAVNISSVLAAMGLHVAMDCVLEDVSSNEIRLALLGEYDAASAVALLSSVHHDSAINIAQQDVIDGGHSVSEELLSYGSPTSSGFEPVNPDWDDNLFRRLGLLLKRQAEHISSRKRSVSERVGREVELITSITNLKLQEKIRLLTRSTAALAAATLVAAIVALFVSR